MNPRSTDPGPPCVKELEEPMNKPAPIAPPLSSVSVQKIKISGYRHGNHLHVSTLEVAMEIVLLPGFHDDVRKRARPIISGLDAFLVRHPIVAVLDRFVLMAHCCGFTPARRYTEERERRDGRSK